jgi:hypothetical protein
VIFSFVSARSQVVAQTCALTEASPKIKNPPSAPLHHFCQCSSKKSDAFHRRMEKTTEIIGFFENSLTFFPD